MCAACFLTCSDAVWCRCNTGSQFPGVPVPKVCNIPDVTAIKGLQQLGLWLRLTLTRVRVKVNPNPNSSGCRLG